MLFWYTRLLSLHGTRMLFTELYNRARGQSPMKSLLQEEGEFNGKNSTPTSKEKKTVSREETGRGLYASSCVVEM